MSEEYAFTFNRNCNLSIFTAHFAMLFQWACSGTPGGGRCFPDNRFLASCHLLGTLSPNYVGSLLKVKKRMLNWHWAQRSYKKDDLKLHLFKASIRFEDYYILVQDGSFWNDQRLFFQLVNNTFARKMFIWPLHSVSFSSIKMH